MSSYNHSAHFTDEAWEQLGREADELEAYREAEKVRLRGNYRPPPIALSGSKFCPQCRGRSKLSDGCDCPACDGTGFKELITLEDAA